MSDFDSSFDPQPPIFSDLKPAETNSPSPDTPAPQPSAYEGKDCTAGTLDSTGSDSEYVYVNPNPIDHSRDTSSQNETIFDNIPDCVFQEDSEEYERMQQAMSSGKNAAKMSLNFGCIALGLYFSAYCASCCCCFGNLFQIAAAICAVIGLVYGILGIQRTKEFGTDSNAIIGLIMSAAVLLLFIGAIVFTLLYYGVMFGAEMFTMLPDILSM